MVQILRDIGVWVGTGPLAPVAIVLGFITTIAALIILILELSGRTISGFKLVPSTFKFVGCLNWATPPRLGQPGPPGIAGW